MIFFFYPLPNSLENFDPTPPIFFFFSFLFVRFNGKKVYSDKIFPILSTWYIRNFTFGMLPARIKPNLHNRIREYTSLQTD